MHELNGIYDDKFVTKVEIGLNEAEKITKFFVSLEKNGSYKSYN